MNGTAVWDLFQIVSSSKLRRIESSRSSSRLSNENESYMQNYVETKETEDRARHNDFEGTIISDRNQQRPGHHRGSAK